MSSHATPAPLGGKIWTPFFQFLAGIFAVSVILMIWRFVAGLGAVTGLSDAYPWGIWIAFDVVIGTALGCGGYAMALLVYIFNRGQYHPLVRPAVLTSALGYTMAAIAINIDVGRTPYIYKIPFMPHWWNLNSVLLEVALCVMAYVAVLWFELAPALFETWRKGSSSFFRWLADTFDPIIRKLMIPILAIGVLLPTMHQSSLGALMMLAGNKLHGLWQSPLLPLLFLISCIGMGYAVVVFEAHLSSRAFRRPSEAPMLARLGVVTGWITVAYLAIRLGDLVVRGKLGLAFQPSFQALAFWVEIALFAGAAFLMLTPARRGRAMTQFNAAVMIILAGSLYRIDTYLTGYNPGDNWSYFPALPEILITLGILALEIMAYLYIVKRYPILAGGSSTAPARA
ncbi:MAG: Polysulfide reductase NrfD [Acidobacteria bacterium]|nr:Polysulfide reductase NrfD [Acidobacteriota bacterium]